MAKLTKEQREKLKEEFLADEPDWRCIDCGFNTARRSMTKAGKKRWTWKDTWDDELYTVYDFVWAKAGMKPLDGCLCVGCLEKRIGRRLIPSDFDPVSPFNRPDHPASERLRSRRHPDIA